MDKPSPIPVGGLYEAHLTVRDLDRSCDFYGNVLGFRLAARFDSRRVAFFWLGESKSTMLGVWEIGSGPVAVRSHVAFAIGISEMYRAVDMLRERGITPLGFRGEEVDEPVVIGWMPALSLYFVDPDGHSLEYITVLQEDPNPQVGVVPWSEWRALRSE